jgi:ABC-type sugar transport system ATPase subunit
VSAVEFHHIDKSFGAVAALTDVSFTIEAGETHAIVGENGAGKSTLLKILAGTLRPDRGELRIGGGAVSLASPRDALARGIGLVHQEMLAFPNLSVTANIFAGRELRGTFGLLRESAMRERARALLTRLYLPISPDAMVEALPVAYRQLLQVARALAFECRTLALDEPTTSLTAAETDHLFAVLDGLERAGVTIIYVSHRLAEVFRLCDRITALRDGHYVNTFRRADVTQDAIVQAMVGRNVDFLYPRGAPPARADSLATSVNGRGATAPLASLTPSRSLEPQALRSGVSKTERHNGSVPRVPALLRLDGLTSRPCFENVSLSIAPGEIIGIFGLVGSGRTELLETIVGLRPVSAGTLTIDGRAYRFRSPRAAARAGIVLVPEDRQRQGLFFNLNLRHNLMLPSAEARDVRVVRDSERDRSAGLLRQWRIVAPSIEATPGALSGGNQQKVVAAKWLALKPRVLLLDEPTKGVDVGAKYDIHRIVREMAAGGTGCLLVSSDLPEVLALADRILVMREGRLRGQIDASKADEEAVMRMAATAEASA